MLENILFFLRGRRKFDNFQPAIEKMTSILSSLLQSKSTNDPTANGTRLASNSSQTFAVKEWISSWQEIKKRSL